MNKCIYTNKDDSNVTFISTEHVFPAVGLFFNSSLSNFKTIINSCANTI